MNRRKTLAAVSAALALCLTIAPSVFAEDAAADAPVMEFFEPVVKGEGVAVDAAKFPDEGFRKYVSDNIDGNSDGVLSQTEIEGVTEIKVSCLLYICSDLKGVEYFINLES